MKTIVYLIELFFDTFFKSKFVRRREIRDVLARYNYKCLGGDFMIAYSSCGNEVLEVFFHSCNSLDLYWDKQKGLSYSAHTLHTLMYKTREGVNITGQILTDVEDINNLQSYEHGIIKLKYGLTKEDVSIPPVVREILGEEECRRRFL